MIYGSVVYLQDIKYIGKKTTMYDSKQNSENSNVRYDVTYQGITKKQVHTYKENSSRLQIIESECVYWKTTYLQ